MPGPSPDVPRDVVAEATAGESLTALLQARYADHPAAERLAAHVPAVWANFGEVYGEGAQQRAWVVEAVDAAVEGFENRALARRELDRSREGRADWFQGPEQLGYTCYVDQFAGSLSGVREKIPYLQELGVTYLHLMPLLEPRDPPNDGATPSRTTRPGGPPSRSPRRPASSSSG